MEQSINIRLAILKEQLGCNWSELAQRIGVSRQMLGDVRNGICNFGTENKQKVEELEKEAGCLYARDEETTPYTVPSHCTCAGCLAKDRQIAELNAQLNQAQAIALALAESGRAKPPVAHASGAGCGDSLHPLERSTG